jgi:hypothetical protein
MIIQVIVVLTVLAVGVFTCYQMFRSDVRTLLTRSDHELAEEGGISNAATSETSINEEEKCSLETRGSTSPLAAKD